MTSYAITAGFLVSARPEGEREPLRAALDTAAVLHWFDAKLLAKILAISEEEARKRFDVLKALPFVERYPSREHDLRNLHESTRLGWRKHLARDTPERFRRLSARAATCFAEELTPTGRIEWIYHLLCGDPDHGAAALEKLDREWTDKAHPEDRYGLATVLKELDDAELMQGRARVWALLTIAWTRVCRGEAARLTDVARETLRFARSLADERAEAEAQCLLGDVLSAQGKLGEAHAEFSKHLSISRRLAEGDPSNVDWQRDLGVSHNRLGIVLHTQGKLAESQTEFGEDLAISRRLAELDPSDTGWQRDLAVAHSRFGFVLQAQGKLAEARVERGESLAICRRLAELDPSNADWQWDLAVEHSRVGEVLQVQGKLAESQAEFGEYLAISRRLAELDPGNTDWQWDLAVAHSRVGEVLQAQNKLAEAQAEFEEYLAISRRLAELDPSNADWQRELALAHGRVGEVQQAQGKLAQARAEIGECLAISRRLAKLDPSNAGSQRELAMACVRSARIQSSAGRRFAALPLYEEASRILANLVERAPEFAQWVKDKEAADSELAHLRSQA